MVQKTDPDNSFK